MVGLNLMYKDLKSTFTLVEAIISLKTDVRAIADIMARGEGDLAFEDLYMSIMNTLTTLETNESKA